MAAESLFTALIERHPDGNVQHRDLQSKLALSVSDSRGHLLAEAGGRKLKMVACDSLVLDSSMSGYMLYVITCKGMLRAV